MKVIKTLEDRSQKGTKLISGISVHQRSRWYWQTQCAIS